MPPSQYNLFGSHRVLISHKPCIIESPIGKRLEKWYFCFLRSDQPRHYDDVSFGNFNGGNMVFSSRRTQDMNQHSSLTAAWAWSKRRDLPINSAKCNYLTIVQNIQDLWFQTDNAFSPFIHCFEAANKATLLMLIIRRLSQDLPKSAFIPLYGATIYGALVRPHLEYGMPSRSPNLVSDINY